MTKEIKVSIKTPFGEVEVSGETAEEVLQLLQSLSPEFCARLNSEMSHLASEQSLNGLEGVVESTREGPIIVTKRKLTHYEAIALILYCLKDNQGSARELRGRLSSSGKKVTVPARLNEMRKKGYIFKPNPRAPEYKLSTSGIKWVEEEILPRLQAQNLLGD
ncbi:MAG: hypothetical protein ACETVR_03235 [Candidatus Bathyarchaeia archaeon]